MKEAKGSRIQLKGTSRALVEALALCQDRVVMDRIWDLLDEVEGPFHAPITRKRMLASNPSAATLEMLDSRQQLYPLNDFVSMLTTPGFMALAGIVGPAPLLDESALRPGLLFQWLTRSYATMNSRQAVQIIDALASPTTIDSLSSAVWRAFFTTEKLGYSRASIEPAVLRLAAHQSTFIPSASQCVGWLCASAYGYGRHRAPLIDIMLSKVLHDPTIDQARKVASAGLSGFREAIIDRDDDMACNTFKETTSMSLGPRRLRKWLDTTAAHHDPRIMGMFVGSYAHAASKDRGVARIAEAMIKKTLPSSVDIDEDAARQMMQEIVAIIMPARVEAQGMSTSTSAAIAQLDQNHEVAWNSVLAWAECLPSGPVRAVIEKTRALALAPVEGSEGYEVRRQAVLMHLDTMAPASPVAPAPRF